MSIEAQSGRGQVLITVTVGEKRARLKVTPQYARNLAAGLMVASAEADELAKVPQAIADLFDGILGKKGG